MGDEPVQACPPTAWYQLRKFARRNKARLVIATAMVLAVLVAVGGIGWVLRDRSARHAELNYRVELAIEDAGLARDRALSQTDNRFQWEATRATALSALKRGEALAAQDSAALDPGVAKRLQAASAKPSGRRRQRLPFCCPFRRNPARNYRVERAQERVERRGILPQVEGRIPFQLPGWQASEPRLRQKSQASFTNVRSPSRRICWQLLMSVSRALPRITLKRGGG